MGRETLNELPHRYMERYDGIICQAAEHVELSGSCHWAGNRNLKEEEGGSWVLWAGTEVGMGRKRKR